MAKLFAWAAAESDGCRFYRLELPFTYLQRRGHDVKVSMNMSNEDMLSSSVIVCQRTANYHATSTLQLAAFNDMQRIVFEIDDDIFSVPPDSAAYAGWSYVDYKQAVEANATVAHVVTVSTETLAGVFRDLSENVHVLPNTVPATLLNLDRGRHKGIRVGYGGSPTHAGDWAPYVRAIGDAIRGNVSGHDAMLSVTGPTPDGLNAPAVNEPWCERVPDWWRRVATFDIGLAPLVDNRFNRSKSFIKILEYAALGVPFIASPVGPYADHVVDGVTGFLASTPDEWAERLDQLIRSPWLRMKIGGAARDWAAEWTTDRWIGKWEELYLNG